jgi:hypothetical protein
MMVVIACWAVATLVTTMACRIRSGPTWLRGGLTNALSPSAAIAAEIAR